MASKIVIGKSAFEGDATADGRPSSSSDASKASWNTTRTGSKPMMTYASRMTMSFALTALLTVAVLVVVLALVWESQFQTYTRSNMVRLAEATAQSVEEAYDDAGAWTDEVIARAANASTASSDVGVQLVDSYNNILFDDTWALSSDAGQSLGGQSRPRVSLAPTNTDSIVSANVNNANGDVVGKVRIWAFGSDALLTKNDAAFRANSYGAIAAAAGIAVILACLIGFVVARSLSRPIQSITRTALQIRNGDLTARTKLSGSDEIGQLGQTFDDMASSLEKDLKLEHSLTSDVAHELRTPLMAMLATVEAMQDGVLPCDQERLATVSGEVRRLSRLVDAMLKLSRLENGTTAFEPKPTDLVTLVRGIVDSQQQLFSDQGLKLRFSNDTLHGDIVVDVDRDMIRQAVINLMSNAMRYTPEDGWVVVTVAQDRTDALIAVSDTGIGIAKEDLSRVFSRFWRSDASRERAAGGLGIGLAVTKEIIDRHHGFISVESELGHGTTFTFHLPIKHHALPMQSSSTMDA